MSSDQICYIMNWNPGKEQYALVQLDPTSGTTNVSGPWTAPNAEYTLLQTGNYVLAWKGDGSFDLWSLEHGCEDLFSGSPVQSGRLGSIGTGHDLVPVGRYVLDWKPADGSYRLWQLDPEQSDPLAGNPYDHNNSLQSGQWSAITSGHQLVPIGNYVLDWVPGQQSAYSLWQFDPQNSNPLPNDTATNGPVQTGTWSTIDSHHQLIPIGNYYVLDWKTSDNSFRVWPFDSTRSDPLPGNKPVSRPQLSDTAGNTLIGLQPVMPRPSAISQPGTMDYMRANIKKVVYFILENRSFDHVVGWLYENGATPNFIPTSNQSPYNGASSANYNLWNGTKYHTEKFQPNGGGLVCPAGDPYHDHGNVMKQMFGAAYVEEYAQKQPPTMGNFAGNYGSGDVMKTFTPDQLTILNGLAGSYAVSDDWFCSMPGATDINRAFALTGSSFGRTHNFESGSIYDSWPSTPRRASIWSTLWSHGIDNWKIYYYNDWGSYCYTYHLFADGQIPSLGGPSKTLENNGYGDRYKDYVRDFDYFLRDAAAGTLPTFSFIEPAWFGTGTPYPENSYHPNMDLVTPEQNLSAVFDALLSSPDWPHLLFVISFDEHGGIYDHVPPPYGVRPFANDLNNDYGDNFEFDLLGVRVPTILASPWIAENTVFRSPTSTLHDSTSILATLLAWFGIPKQNWALGQRTDSAPTFEGVFTQTAARTDKPTLVPPTEQSAQQPSQRSVSDFERAMACRIVGHLGQGKMEPAALQQASDEIVGSAQSLEQLRSLLAEFRKKVGSIPS